MNVLILGEWRLVTFPFLEWDPHLLHTAFQSGHALQLYFSADKTHKYMSYDHGNI